MLTGRFQPDGLSRYAWHRRESSSSRSSTPYATGRVGAVEKIVQEEKNLRKSTYPPPADALCVIFLCKSQGCAIRAQAQAGCGLWQAIGLFILCKALQRNAKTLHRQRVVLGYVLGRQTQWQ